MAGIKGKRRLVVKAGDSATDETCRTFIFENETHTLGNALRHAILQNPRVTFCGYSMPHPAEDKMLVRVQTVEGYSAPEALKQGLLDLKQMCQITKKTFVEAVDDFKSQQQQQD